MKAEVVTSYGTTYDLTEKNPRLNQWFHSVDANAAVPENAGKEEPTPQPTREAAPAKPKAPPAPEPSSAPEPKIPKAAPMLVPKPSPPKPADVPAPSKEPSVDQLEQIFEAGQLLREVEDPACCWKLVHPADEQFPRIMIKTMGSSNRKFARLQLIYWSAAGKLVKSMKGQPDDTVPYTEGLAATSHVIDCGGQSKSVVLLKELVASSGVDEIHGFKSFAPGVLPAKLTPIEGGSLFLKPDEILLGIQRALVLVNHCSIAWGFMVQGKKLVPIGAGLLSVKQMNLQANKIVTLPA